MRAKLSVFAPTFCFLFLNAFQEIGAHFFCAYFCRRKALSTNKKVKNKKRKKL
jgi:hypothetical protein